MNAVATRADAEGRDGFDTDRLPAEIDVLIVGYGPVGAAMAGLLGRYGVRVLVVDKAPGIFMAPRAIALDNEALRILQMVGLPPGAFATRPIPHVRMHCPNLGEFARINTTGTLDGHPKLVTFHQPELEHALRANLESMTHVATRTGVEMVHFTDDGDGVSVVLRTGDGEDSVVRARYLVGADGASSGVRAAIGEAFDGETYGEDWLIVDALDVPGTFDHVEFLCDPARPTPHMVAPGGRTRWEFMLRPGETRDEMENDATIAKLLEPWARSSPIRIERKAVYRFHARVCKRFSKGRVFLAGDAAHITPPFAGQGLVAGLRDAANLAWKLAWVLRGRASETILDTYDRERRPHAAKMIALAKRMGRLIMPRDRFRAVIVHGLLALVRRFPAGRALVDELGMKPQNVFDEGLFVAAGKSELRGAPLPQRTVRSGEVDRLSDDVLGSGLTLVGLGVDPEQWLSDRNRRRWRNAGGSSVRFADDHFGDERATRGRCVVVRPDRTVLHDGPVEEVDRLVRESLRLLGTPAM